MTAAIRPPIPELVAVADLLEEAVGVFLQARQRKGRFGRWEAPLEAWTISNLLIRNVEAVVTLARMDQVFVAAAWANARAVFEYAVRIIWLLHPRDRFESEMRWVALLAEYERACARIAMTPGLSPVLAEPKRAMATALAAVRAAVIARAPQGYKPPARVPKLEAMLLEIGAPEMYHVYIQGSQYLHGTMLATTHYRRNFGSRKEFGEFVIAVDWILPLRVCWLSLREASKLLIDRLLGSHASLDWTALSNRIDVAFQAVALTAPAHAGEGEEKGSQ
jgi:hypothetical protein